MCRAISLSTRTALSQRRQLAPTTRNLSRKTPILVPDSGCSLHAIFFCLFWWSRSLIQRMAATLAYRRACALWLTLVSSWRRSFFVFFVSMPSHCLLTIFALRLRRAHKSCANFDQAIYAAELAMDITSGLPGKPQIIPAHKQPRNYPSTEVIPAQGSLGDSL